MKYLAHSITLWSLVFALIAAITLHQRWLIWSLFCDRIDGYVARRTHSTSTMWYYLDALCDAIAFGFVPAYIFIQVYPGFFQLIVGIIYLICWVVRLARFLSLSHNFIHQKNEYYVGMPITINWLVIPLLFYIPGLMVVWMMISAWLMISTFHFKKL